MSAMTTTTFLPAERITPLQVIVGHDGEHGVVRHTLRVGEQVKLECVQRSYYYPPSYMVEVVIPDPRARVTTHVDDVAVGDVVIMSATDPRFPRPVEVMVEVTEVGDVYRAPGDALVQDVRGRMVDSRILCTVTVDAAGGQLDVVGNVAMAA